MTIHQVADNHLATNPLMTVRVKSQNQLIGESFYAPTLDIENLSDSPIRVIKIDLIAQGMTFQSRPLGSDGSFQEIAPHRSETVKLWFDLSDRVYKFFHRPAELRIHYRSGNSEQIASMAIIGGPLQQSAP